MRGTGDKSQIWQSLDRIGNRDMKKKEKRKRNGTQTLTCGTTSKKIHVGLNKSYYFYLTAHKVFRPYYEQRRKNIKLFKVSTPCCSFPCRKGLVSGFTFWRHQALENCCSFANTVFCIVIQNANLDHEC